MSTDSRSTSYAELLSVDIRHSFFRDGRCASFEIEPTPDTTHLLRGHRCILRDRSDGFSIVTPLDTTGAPFLPLPEGSRLVFRMACKDRDLALFTDLSAIERILSAGGSPVFTNVTQSAGSGDALNLVSGARSGAFAQIVIGILPSAASGPPVAEYWVPFEAKHAYWAYYCVTDLPLSTIARRKLSIVDDAPEPIVFDATLLDQTPDSSDPLATQLAKLYSDKRRIRFLSRQAIQCSEAARKQLKLVLGTDDLLRPLPNPAPRRFCEAKTPSLPQYRLFQIIEYTANP